MSVFPPDSYPPIVYPFAIVSGRDKEPVRSFFSFITTGPAAKVYENSGSCGGGPRANRG